MPVTTVLLAAADTTAIDSAVTDMVSTVEAVITSALPVVLPICGIIVAASVAVRLFKRFAKG